MVTITKLAGFPPSPSRYPSSGRFALKISDGAVRGVPRHDAAAEIEMDRDVLGSLWSAPRSALTAANRLRKDSQLRFVDSTRRLPVMFPSRPRSSSEGLMLGRR